MLPILTHCSRNDDIKPKLAGKIFNHLFFDTEQECIDAQPSPDLWINCAQTLEFIDNEQATIIFTDIVNAVMYNTYENTIVVTPTSSSEFSNDIIFEIVDQRTLKRIDDGTIWKEQKGDSIWE